MAFPTNPVDRQIHNRYIYNATKQAWEDKFLYGMTEEYQFESLEDIFES